MPQNDSAMVPVYLPMATVHSAIQSLREHGLPPKLDRTAWKSRSGADQTGLISAFKFLGLIDDQGHTQPLLRRLKDATPNQQDEKAVWAEILRQRYSKLFEMDLTSATPNMIGEAMSHYGNPSASVKKRAIRFFLKTSQHAGVSVSSRLLKDMRERSDRVGAVVPEESNGAKPRRKKRTGNAQPRQVDVQQAATGQGDNGAMKTISLVVAGGTLTLNGTFNPFKLVGDERTLVYDIIDKMNAYEAKGDGVNE